LMMYRCIIRCESLQLRNMKNRAHHATIRKLQLVCN
jgi:hypothetical protein